MKLSSPVFTDGGPIPEKYGYTKENVNPPLKIEGVPEEAESLVLFMDDPDAMKPAGRIWDHWTVWNINPNTGEIAEDTVPTDAVEGRNDYGENEYGGPNPPDKKHTYRFRLYALDTELNLPRSATKKDVEKAMKSYIVAEAQLTRQKPKQIPSVTFTVILQKG